MSFSHDGDALSRAGILNRVFENFYEHSKVSVPLQIEARRRELSDILIDFPEQDREAVVARLVESFRKDLISEILGLLKHGASDMAWNMTIRKDLGSLLENLCKRGFFSYSNEMELSRGKYMGAVFEEYAMLPFVERERMYSHSLFESIEDAIEFKRAINIIYTQDKVPYFVIPHFLETDKLSMYNYLVGYARRAGSQDKTLSIHSFRLSKIHSVEIDRHLKPGLGELSSNQRAEQLARIKKSREKLGTMFISDEDKTTQIEVRLTPKGKQKYIEQVHMRPSGQLKPDSDDVYIFICPQRQAEYYFWKFGDDAEVLSPPALREKFSAKYKEALEQYGDNLC
jgi:predicted DNA-binding transcriptional regulator YafY